MKKNYIKSIAVLGAICLVIAALLATVNYFTAPVIKENSAAKENASLSEVLPGSKKFKAEKLPELTSDALTAAPGLGQSTAQVVHNVDELVGKQ